jgi:outer membrane autotransporter protein
MKKYILMGAIASTFAFNATEGMAAEYSPYISGKVGLTISNDEDWKYSGYTGEISADNAANFAFAVGTNVTPNIRSEVELSYRKVDLDKVSYSGIDVDISGENKTWGLMLNGYYDFMPENEFTPYVSAGIGLLRHDGKIDAAAGYAVTDEDGNDTTFGYQLGLGASLDIADNVSFDGGYRYLGSSDIKMESTYEYDSHEIRFGLRYQF